MNIERQLAEALVRREPDDAFTARVMAGVTGPAARNSRWRVPAALAASLLVALTGLQLFNQHRERQQALEMQQLLLALEITSEHLNDAQRRLSRLNDKENGS